MCGRYAATANPGELVEEFEVEEDRTADPVRSLLATPQQPPAGTPDTNMAPTKAAPVVLTRRPRGDDDTRPVRQLRLMSWGLVPSWARDVKVGLRLINARRETVLSKFAKAAQARRCLVPAQGWYEWQASPTAVDARGRPRKQPFFVHRADGADLAFAGLYEFWRDAAVTDPDDPRAWVTSFAIVTTEAEPGLDRIHDRQPLVLERDLWARWLDLDLRDPGAVQEMLAFADPGRFVAYPVTTAVNNVRSSGPQLLERADPAGLSGVVDPMTGEVLP